MNRTELHTSLSTRTEKLPDCSAKQAFQEDLHALFEWDNDQSLPGITASIWLDQLAELPDDRFQDYVKNYTAGRLRVSAMT